MIEDQDSTGANSNTDAEAEDETSKSQRKREADAVRDLGSHLAELGASELATMPLPDDILAAIKELNRIKAHGARKRQLGFLAKKMRHIDSAPIQRALENLRQAARANTRNLQIVEQWRDRMLGNVAEESPKEALTQFLDEYVHADRQHFRHLQRQSLTERERGSPPSATRQLFKAIRDVVITTSDEP